MARGPPVAAFTKMSNGALAANRARSAARSCTSLDPSPHALLGALRMATGRDHGHPFTGQLVGGCQSNPRSATQDNGSLPLQCHRLLPLSRVPRSPAPVSAESRVPYTSSTSPALLDYCPALIKSAQRSAIII